MDKYKYPRTPHLLTSPGASPDDDVAIDLSVLEAAEIVLTEKMDGENTTIGPGYTHARSMDSGPHPSRTWVRALAGRLAHDLPEDMRICGENLYARHSIGYDALTSYFMVFNIWEGDCCLDWDATCTWAGLLGLDVVPQLYRGRFTSLDDLHRRWQQARAGAASEGYVIRTVDGFTREQFSTHLAKWVRPGHVQTDQHWMTADVVPNRLAGQ